MSYLFSFIRFRTHSDGSQDTRGLEVPVSVIAPSEPEARALAGRLSSDPPRGLYWNLRLVEVVPLEIALARARGVECRDEP